MCSWTSDDVFCLTGGLGGFNYQPIIYYQIVLNVFYLSMLFLRLLMQTFSKKQEKTGFYSKKE